MSTTSEHRNPQPEDEVVEPGGLDLRTLFALGGVVLAGTAAIAFLGFLIFLAAAFAGSYRAQRDAAQGKQPPVIRQLDGTTARTPGSPVPLTPAKDPRKIRHGAAVKQGGAVKAGGGEKAGGEGAGATP